ncbi:Speckle targeted PIP5K1A-regulated poly(A) polymerase [Aphelenchoides bicaudatus]|nr:Speckle targeted PIP5K1A-regulated poly(A) polymerase [Aphelenchoides bicaudatus]
MKYRCDLCGVNVDSEKWLDEHTKGKAHQTALARQEELKKLEAHSIFLAGFKHPIVEEQLNEIFKSFGQISKIILDKKGGKFAILEFLDSSVVAKLIELKHIKVGEDKITIKKRKVDFGKQTKEKTPDNSAQENVIKLIEKLHSDDVREYLHRIFEHYHRDSSHLFLAQLTLSSRFLIRMWIFVSFPEITISTNKMLVINQMEILISCLKISQISVLLKFTCPHLTVCPNQLLTRVLNEFRKETRLITSLNGVPDARTPIIRFTYTNAVHDSAKLSIDFEISLNNFLGMHKGRFVRNALNDDLLLMLFLIRLWARCFKLLHDPAHPKGHWSSYALSLIFVQFCQIQGYISKVQTIGTETVKGWPVGYEVLELPTKSCGLDEFFLNFFKFLASTFNQSPVLSIRHGCLYKQDEFKNQFDNQVVDKFKLSLVNVQDPLELDHNVTQNVSEDYLKLLRSQSMRVICNLKADPSNPINALFAEKSTKPPVPKIEQPGSSEMEIYQNGDDEPAGKRAKFE